MSVRTFFFALWWILSALLATYAVRFAVAVVQYYLSLSLPPTETFTFSRLMGTLLAAGVMALFARFVHRRGLKLYGLVHKGLMRDTLAGFGLGVSLVGIVVVVMGVAGWYRIESIDLNALLGSLALMLAVGLFEEFLYRGLVFAPLEAKLGTWVALSLSALIFGGLHLTNEGATALSTANTVFAGAALALAFVLSRNLWLPSSLHAGWNFALLAFGLAVSGRDFPTPIAAAVSGPEVWVGGIYGPEAGLLTTLLWGLVTLTLGYVAVRRKRIVPLVTTQTGTDVEAHLPVS